MLGDITGDRTVMLLLTVFQFSGVLDFKWTPLYIQRIHLTMCTFSSDLGKIRISSDLSERNLCIWNGGVDSWLEILYEIWNVTHNLKYYCSSDYSERKLAKKAIIFITMYDCLYANNDLRKVRWILIKSASIIFSTIYRQVSIFNLIINFDVLLTVHLSIFI